MVSSPVRVRLVTRFTLSTGLGPRRPMVVVEAGDAVHFVVLGVCGQCRVSLVRLLARVCCRRWFVCLSACRVGAGVGRLPVRVAVVLGSVRWALGGLGWVRMRVLMCTWCGLRGVCGRRVPCCRACGGLCCLVERRWCVLWVDGVGPGRCWCGCLGSIAGCGRVVYVVWSGVMVGSPTCAAGWWRVWSVVRCPVRAVGVGSVWAGWWWWLVLDCLVVAAAVGGPDGRPRVC